MSTQRTTTIAISIENSPTIMIIITTTQSTTGDQSDEGGANSNEGSESGEVGESNEGGEVGESDEGDGDVEMRVVPETPPQEDSSIEL